MENVWKDGERWHRTAPCGHVVSHTNKYNAKASAEKDRLCKQCSRLPHNNAMYGKPGTFKGKKHTDEAKKKMSERSLAQERTEASLDLARANLAKVANTRPVYDIWVEKYGEAEADKRREDLRAKQRTNSSGASNPMYGKPAPNGSGVGWKGWYQGRFFRSLRELSFMVNNPEYEGAETAYWTAHYVDYAGTSRTTRPDFVCTALRAVVECKPLRLHTSPAVLDKKKAMEDLCQQRGYTYTLVDPPILPKEVILDLMAGGVVRFSGKYEEKVRRWNG